MKGGGGAERRPRLRGVKKPGPRQESARVREVVQKWREGELDQEVEAAFLC